MDRELPGPDHSPPDAELLDRVRAGDTGAYGLLFARHREAAMAQARRVSRSVADADDLVAEGSAKVLCALLGGGGPREAFRAYLLSTIRHLAYDRTHHERRESPAAETADAVVVDLADPILHDFECSTAAAAFVTLPDRWKLVLWYTEVEGLAPARVAELLNMTPNAAAALAYRAREGLRQAYLSRHAAVTPRTGHACRLTSDRLASFIRGGLTPARRSQVAEHLAACPACCAAHRELTDINGTLRAVAGSPAVGAPAEGTDEVLTGGVGRRAV